MHMEKPNNEYQIMLTKANALQHRRCNECNDKVARGLLDPEYCAMILITYFIQFALALIDVPEDHCQPWYVSPH
jgi:hypothetical protein